MNPWPFVIAAYVCTVLGVVALFGASYLAMRKAEREADQLSKRK